MSLTDNIRLNILDSLLKKNSVSANIRQIKRYTGYHKATIKSSLEFMQKEGLLQGFGPKVDLKKLGYSLEIIALWETDFSKKEAFQKLLETMKNDPHVYRFSSAVGPGNWNMIVRYIYKDMESYHKTVRQKYDEMILGIHDLVRDRQIFYEVEPYYKTSSRTDSIIKIIKLERGYD